jgi:hypothetical protein
MEQSIIVSTVEEGNNTEVLGSKAEEARIDLELGLGTGLLEGNCVGGL